MYPSTEYPLKELQSAFLASCRDGKERKIPGTLLHRVEHYHTMVSNIFRDTLEAAFPVTLRYTTPSQWDAMMHDFVATHKCTSTQIWKIAREFCEYIGTSGWPEKLHLPYLPDLLQFEWTELEVFNMPDRQIPEYSADGNWLTQRLVFNPEFRLLSLRYPVHTTTPEELTAQQGTYFLLAYRYQDAVHFIDLSIWFALAIEHLYGRNMTVNQFSGYVLARYNPAEELTLRNQIIEFLKEMQKQNFIYGFKKLIQ